MSEHETQRHRLDEAAELLAGADPQTVLRWALQQYRPRIVLACSFGGPSGMVLLDMVMELDRTTPVYYLDTGLLFPQTYELVERVSARYNIVPHAVRTALSVEAQSAQYGNTLWSREPDACCSLRKVEPQRAFLAEYDAWITGLRRNQSRSRAQTPVVAWDAQFKLAKIAPLAVGMIDRSGSTFALTMCHTTNFTARDTPV